MPRKPRRRRGASGEPRLTSPLPETPPPTIECDVRDDVLCVLITSHHIASHHHQRQLRAYLSETWAVVGATSWIRRFGIGAVNELALEIMEADQDDALGHIRSVPSFMRWELGQRAGEESSKSTDEVSERRRKMGRNY